MQTNDLQFVLKSYRQTIFLKSMCKKDLASNNHQGLICHKKKNPNKTKKISCLFFPFALV